jgi:hypothetical protein
MIKRIFLIVFFSLGVFFSFYHLSQQYIFEYDREGNYYAAKSIVVDHKFTLIGPAVHASIYLGPWGHYAQVPFFVALKGDPIYGAYLIATVNFTVFLLIYLFLKKVTHSQLVAMCAALVWVSSANRLNGLVTFVPLFSMTFLLLYEKFIREKNIILLSLLTLVWSFSLNFHPQMILLAPIWLYGVILFLAGNRKSWLKSGIILLITLLIPVLPVIIFDFRHNFLISGAVMKFLSGETAVPTRSGVSHFRLLYSLRQFSLPIVLPLDWLNHNPPFSVLLLSLGGLFVSLKKNFIYLLLISIGSILMMSTYQQKTWPEYYHYLGGLSLFLLLFIGAGKSRLLKYVFLGLSLFIIWSNYLFLNNYAEPYSYFYKRQVILYMLEKNKPYDKMNIENDFRFGDGLGFGPIREYYEKQDGLYPPSLRFYVSYADSPKHNSTKVTFGAYAVSMINEK